MEKEIIIHDIEHRLATLERTVASLVAEKSRGQDSDEPCGKFASIGGIERHPAHPFEGSQSVDLSDAYGETGKRIR